MLAALILLGLLPLAAMPIADAMSGNGSDEAETDLSDEDVSKTWGDDALTLGDDPQDLDDGPQPGETLITDFEPGNDMVQLDLVAQTEPISVEFGETEDGAQVAFWLDADTPTILTFSGLETVPVGDILLQMPDAETGEPDEITLADAMATGTISVIGEMPDQDVAPSSDASDGGSDEDVGPNGTLSDLINTQSENTAGRDAAASAVGEVGANETKLTGGDDVLVMPDLGETDGGDDVLMSEATPILGTDGPVEIVDGGAGDDAIFAGDAVGYVFGGEGDDTLAAGDAVAALYGGEGEDALSAVGAAAYLDGGVGDDTLLGGAEDDILEGGEHSGAQSAGDDVIDGGAGDDLIRGGYGADSLLGGSGDDVVDHLGRTEERANGTEDQFDWHIDEAADTLDGGAGDDTLYFDQFDDVTGGTGADTFWLYQDGIGGDAYATINDFTVGQDFLRISYNPASGDPDDLEVTVTPSADQSDGLVMLNGELVAVLKGAPTATTSDVFATVEPEVFT